jgi:hypothetical protein
LANDVKGAASVINLYDFAWINAEGHITRGEPRYEPGVTIGRVGFRQGEFGDATVLFLHEWNYRFVWWIK